MIPLRDIIPSRTTPVVTISLIAVNILVFIYELSLGRDVDSIDKLNTLIRQYNQTLAGKLSPRGQRNPYLFEYGPGVTFNVP